MENLQYRYLTSSIYLVLTYYPFLVEDEEADGGHVRDGQLSQDLGRLVWLIQVAITVHLCMAHFILSVITSNEDPHMFKCGSASASMRIQMRIRIQGVNNWPERKQILIQVYVKILNIFCVIDLEPHPPCGCRSRRRSPFCGFLRSGAVNNQ